MALNEGPYTYDPRDERVRDRKGYDVGAWEPAHGLEVAVAVSSFEALVAALEPFAERHVLLADLICHKGLVDPMTCGRCSRVIAARRALIAAGRWWRPDEERQQVEEEG
jgi:hypothetical protein